MSNKRMHFSILERNFLLRLLEENIDIVESKSNDGVTMRRKDETWASIVSRFNAEPSVVKRTPRQLRKCWTNMKMRAKKSDGSSSLPALVARAPHKLKLRNGPVPVRLQPDSDETSVKDEPVFDAGGSGAETANASGCRMVPVECWSDNEVDEPYSGLEGGSEEGGTGYHQQDQVSEEQAREDFQTGETYSRHETAAGVNDDHNSQWTDVDYVRNEYEAKIALLTIQMETAHEQRELAREMRQQTRQRHRLEMQVLEEKRRYRTMKMNAVSSQEKG